MIPLPSWLRSVFHPPHRGRPAFWIVVLLGILHSTGAAAQLDVVPHPKSRFWIHGNATVRNFTCVVTRVEGTAQLPTRDSVLSEASRIQTTVVVRVPVRAVDCGNRMMTKDLQEALQMKKHPEIRFELIHATMGGRTDTSAQWRRVDALGPLTVAGTKRLIRLHAAVRAYDDEHFRLRGCLPIHMTNFNIEPPTKAFGLIRVKNRVEVRFDLLARTTQGDESSLFDTLSLTNPPTCHE